MLKRFIYLGYYLKKLDFEKVRRFAGHVRDTEGTSTLRLWAAAVLSVFKYNISIQEYFDFKFYQRPESERRTYAGTGFMYEYQLRMNPPEARAILADKIQFLNHFKDFIKHDFVTFEQLQEDNSVADTVLNGGNEKIVLKHSQGQCGRGIEVRSAAEFNAESLLERLKQTGNDMVETFVVQHDDLMGLSPSGLNTVRIITQLTDSGGVDILGARLRITVNSPVDNLAAGNIAAPIDLDSGKVNGPGVYSDITKNDTDIHPVTNANITGFIVPYWHEALDMVRAAALNCPGNRSVGWDVAITADGPGLIEGNHDWCKLLWQLPAGKGLKEVLEKYETM